MIERTKIEWSDWSWNPWVGCSKVSPACDNCYAETWADRFKQVEWGPKSDRRRTKTWGKPVKLNAALEGTGRRESIFCASLADVFDNHRSIQESWRRELWKLIRETPNLDWLLLTKRPQNIGRYLPDDWGDGWHNVWLGTTVENQEEANRRVPHLLGVNAVVRFLSCEPLLGRVDLRSIPNPRRTDMIDALAGKLWVPVGTEHLGGPMHDEGQRSYRDLCARLHWVITGGESGTNYRSADPDWFRDLRDQCAETATPFLFKQWEGRSSAAIKAMGRELDGVVHDGYPTPVAA